MAIETEVAAVHARATLDDLRRLIDALDRRVPRLAQVGAEQIARDAADLRERAHRSDPEDRGRNGNG